MISQIFDQDSFKILSLFSLSPGSKFRRKEIKENTKLNNVPLDNSLQRLLSAGIMVREKSFYSVNFHNEVSKKILEFTSKEYNNMKDLPFNVYLLIIDLVKEICKIKNIEAYLFGSYSKLIYSEDSDIDIALLTSKKFEMKSLQKIIRKLEKIYCKKVEFHFFEKKTFYKNKKDPMIKDILRNGIKLV